MEAGRLEPVTYFDSSTIIVGLILARALAGGACQAADGRRHPRAGRSPGPDRAASSVGDIETDVPDRAGPAGRPRPRAAGREGARRRHRHRRRLGLDQSMLTGESMPVAKGPATRSSGRRIDRSGTFVLRATRVGRGHRPGADRAHGRGRRRVRRRPSSASRTASARSSCPSSWSSRRSRSSPGWSSVPSRASRSRSWRRSPCSSSPAPARWAWPRRPRSWSAPAARPRPASSSVVAMRSSERVT